MLSVHVQPKAITLSNVYCVVQRVPQNTNSDGPSKSAKKAIK